MPLRGIAALEKRIDTLSAEADSAVRLKSNAPKLTTQAFAEQFGGFPLATPDFHVPWYEALDAGSKRLLLLGPREHAKTSVVLTYAKKRIAENRNIRIGVLSQSGPLAKSFIRSIKNALRYDEELQTAYGGTFYNDEKWEASEIIVRGANRRKLGKEVTLFALGSGAQITGRHCDLLIFDDPESAKTVKSQTMRAATKHWFATEAMPVLDPDGMAIVIGSRKHFDDLYNALMLDGSGWEVLDNALSAILPDGSPLWRDKWSLEALLRRKAELDTTDIRAWAQEYENHPIAGEMQMFLPESWPRYEQSPLWFLDHRDEYHIYQGWDTAISDKTKADYTSCVTVAVDVQKRLYILNVVRGHWTIAQVEVQLEEQYRIWRPDTVGIEESGFHAPIVRTWIQNIHVPAKGLKPPGDKVEHGRYLEARAANGGVYVPKIPVSWWGDLARELLEFPEGAHDDQVDALSYALDLALPLSGWQEYFEQDKARMAAQLDPVPAAMAAFTEELSATNARCTLCSGAFSMFRHESTQLRGEYCSKACLEFAERLPQFRKEAA